jgi:hypothetical protein
MLVRRVFPTSPAPSFNGYIEKVGDSPITPRSALPLMMVDRWIASTMYRVAMPVFSDEGRDASVQPKVTYLPNYIGGFPVYDKTVNMVVCERISEFIVDVWNETADGGEWLPKSGAIGNNSSSQTLVDRLEKSGSSYPGREKYLWAGVGPNTNPRQREIPMLPPMIRVTMVVHPHNDETPVRQQPYIGDIPDAYPKKVRGMVFRQIFRLNGRGDANLDTRGDDD